MPFVRKLIAGLRVTEHDLDAGRELYAGDPRAATAVALAEDANLTDEERREVMGELPQRIEEYCARAWTLIDDTLAVLRLPPEIVATIDGDLVGLFAAGLLTRDVRAAGAEDAP